MKVVRVLIYDGDEGWLKVGLNRRAVKGTLITPTGVIDEIFLGALDDPRLLSQLTNTIKES